MFEAQNTFVNSKDTKNNKICQFLFLFCSVVNDCFLKNLKKLVFLIIVSVMRHKKSKDKS